jgi:cbb3-type cytochrome oxidase maturation protein
MNVLYFLVPLALMLASAGVAAFIWSVRGGQFDDVQTPGMRILLEDELEERQSPHRMTASHEESHQARTPEDGVDSEQDDEPTGNS